MRMLHTMPRVGNLDRSHAFYTGVLGMRLLHHKDYPGSRFTLASVGYGDEASHTVLEPAHNWDNARYDLGSAYGHIALGVEDTHEPCRAISEKGGWVVRELGPMKYGSTVIAFMDDPDGYRIELIDLTSKIQTQPSHPSTAQV